MSAGGHGIVQCAVLRGQPDSGEESSEPDGDDRGRAAQAAYRDGARKCETSGKGYADIVFLPKRGSDKPLLVVELKWNKSSAGAIAQIKNKQYAQVVEEFGGEILLVGINYSEKTKKHSCKIEKFLK